MNKQKSRHTTAALFSFFMLLGFQGAQSASARTFKAEWDKVITVKQGVRYYTNPRFHDDQGVVRFGAFKSPNQPHMIPLLAVDESALFCSLVGGVANSDNEILASHGFSAPGKKLPEERYLHLWGDLNSVPAATNREAYSDVNFGDVLVEFSPPDAALETEALKKVISCVDSKIQNDTLVDWSAYSVKSYPMLNNLYYIPFNEAFFTLPFELNEYSYLSDSSTRYQLAMDLEGELKKAANPALDWLCKAAGHQSFVQTFKDPTAPALGGHAVVFDGDWSQTFTNDVASYELSATGVVCL